MEKIHFLRHRPKATLLIIGLLLLSILLSGGALTNKVQVLADGKTITLYTVYSKPEAVVEQAGVYLAKNDGVRVQPAHNGEVKTIEVIRAVPVMIVYGEREIPLLTGKATVREAVEAAGLTADPASIFPVSETRPVSGMRIHVLAAGETFEPVEAPVAFRVEKRPDNHLERGEEQVLRAGEEGRVRYLVKRGPYGQETLNETIVAEPVPELVAAGMANIVETSRGAQRFESVRTMVATAYLPTDGGGAGITATGIRARYGVVAVDPSVIPYGTQVYIPGYGVAVAADTGGAIVGDRIDLCMESYNEAISFGRRSVKVYILES